MLNFRSIYSKNIFRRGKVNCTWLLIFLLSMFNALYADAEQWRLHPSYSGNVSRIIETPDFSYILSFSEPFYGADTDNAVPALSLFRYDKGTEEIEFLNSSNKLNGNLVRCVAYNPDKRYLMIAYLDGNIDMLYDSGETVNIPALKIAGDGYSKVVNSITFSPSENIACLATDFGYVTIDDVKHEVRSTRNFGTPLSCVLLADGKVYAGTKEGLLRGLPENRKISEFSSIGSMPDVKSLLRLPSGAILVRCGENWGGLVYRVRDKENALETTPIISSWLSEMEQTRDGAIVPAYYSIYEISSEGDVKEYRKLPQDESANAAGSWKPGEFRLSRGVDGTVLVKSGGAGEWKEIEAPIMPNAASAYRSTSTSLHPDYGLLIRNHGIDHNFNTVLIDTPDLLSGYRNLEWTPLSNYFRDWSPAFRQRNPNGLAVDPNNKDHVYSGSFLDGIMRVDLADPSRTIRMGRVGDEANGMPGYAAILQDDPAWNLICHFSAPEFDAEGNLWFAHYDHSANTNGALTELWFWTPDDRAGSTSATSLRPWRKLKIEGLQSDARCFIKPLKGSKHSNKLFIWSGFSSGPITILDHKGTPDNPDDDEKYVALTLHDADGVKVDHDVVRSYYEDPSTGIIWLGTSSGVLKLDPDRFMEDPGRVDRIKVARNDGTQLADYLLNGVPVNVIATDGFGRKWFGTPGGIVITDASGTEIMRSYTTDNSPLPSNEIYSISYIPESRSMMISTGGGLIEHFLSSGAAEGEESAVRAYPNPVRPDYYGEVTIDGLPDNALVKIVNNNGALVKELDLAAGGETRWNVTDLNSKRVRSGVYYILASSGPNGSSFSNVGKILVVN